MIILLIPTFNIYSYKWNTKTNYDIIEYYKKNSKNKIYIFYLWRKTKLTKEYIDSIKPDIVIIFTIDTIIYGSNIQILFDYNIPICCAGGDLTYIQKCINCEYIQQCFSIIYFSKSLNLINDYQKHFPKKYITNFNGRFINTNRFKNWNLEKKYDILLFGSYNMGKQRCSTLNTSYNLYKQKYLSYYKKNIRSNKHNIYPFRTKLYNILTNNILVNNKYNIKILKKCGSRRATIANEELSKLINQSYLTIATSSIFDVLLFKYIEIAASYSCILGNIPTDYKKLFKGNIIEISEWMSEEEILNIIDKALEDKKEILNKTERLYNIIQNKYNLNSCVNNFDNTFKKILEQYNKN